MSVVYSVGDCVNIGGGDIGSSDGGTVLLMAAVAVEV